MSAFCQDCTPIKKKFLKKRADFKEAVHAKNVLIKSVPEYLRLIWPILQLLLIKLPKVDKEPFFSFLGDFISTI